MSTADNKRSVIVGIFIFLGLIIFVMGVFTLAGKQKRFVKSITLKTVFDDVSGLQKGNNIWFSGVKVGTVKNIEFYGNSQVEITMNIEEEVQRYIHKDAKAKISSEGFIGNKIIVLYGGNPKSPQVEDGDIIHSETALSTDQVMETLQENNKNLLVITEDFKQLAEKIKAGEGTIGAVLTDSTLAKNFRNIVSNLQTASANAAHMTGSLTSFTGNLNRKGTLAHELVTDTSVFKSIKSSVSQLQRATATASEMADNLKTVSSNLNNTNTPAGVLLNDQEVASDLKTIIKNLETSTQKLDENMEALQHNFLFRGYFKKKAKNEEK
ncbi:MlaD family protein [Rubrolithibacter danxiaensis]|uniref:MlaD family protein n=1 Tax=Rubrolithibacter danxiaensis TaxID=3390805 RepID=UPI003BF8E1B2